MSESDITREENATIHCRAQLVEHCYDGKPAQDVYGWGTGQDEDGTYKNGTVVCDPCYIALGQPSNEELAARGL